LARIKSGPTGNEGRATRSEVMVYAMVVDAKDDAAARFYSHIAFEPSRSDPLRLLRTL
jgi:hypothetical protein